jgi:plastocyanin
LAASVLVAAMIGPVTPRSATAATARVVVANLQFTPAHLEVSVGDMVVWEAQDDGHTVTARDGSFDSSPRGLMGDGDEFRYRFRQPGRYAYFCRIHQNRGMQGEIVVVDPSAPTTDTPLRPVPVTAGATTSSTAATTTTTAAPATTTTTRPLATSSTTSIAMATPSSVPVGDPAVAQEPPTLNPAAPVVGSPTPDSGLPTSEAASRHPGGSGAAPALAVGLGVLVVVGAVGGGIRRRGRRGRRQ